MPGISGKVLIVRAKSAGEYPSQSDELHASLYAEKVAQAIVAVQPMDVLIVGSKEPRRNAEECLDETRKWLKRVYGYEHPEQIRCDSIESCDHDSNFSGGVAVAMARLRKKWDLEIVDLLVVMDGFDGSESDLFSKVEGGKPRRRGVYSI